MSSLEKTFLWVVRCGLLLLLFTPLVVTQNLFFPFITGKNFFFRIIVEIIFGAWVALAIIAPQFRPAKSPLLWALATFFLALSLATVFGADPYHSFWSNYERMEGLITHLHIFALFLVVAHTLRSVREWGYLFAVSVSISVVTAIHGILQGLGVLEVVGGGRPNATFGNSIYLATFLMFHLYILALFFHSLKGTLVRIPLATVFILDLWAFFFASSRGGFIGFLAGVFVIAVSLLIIKSAKIYRFAALTILALVVVVIGLIFLFPHSRIVQSYDLFTRLSNISFKNLSQEPRIMIWQIAWEGFMARPLLGWGPENFIIVYGKYYNPNLYGNEPWFDRAHNMLLEWLVASGIVGFSAYLSVFASAIYVVWVLVKRRTLDAIGGILVLGFLVAYVVQNAFVFDNVVTYTIVGLLFGFLHALYTQQNIRAAAKKVIAPAKLMFIASVLIVSVIFIYTFNMKALMASSRIIAMLKEFSTKGTTVSRVIEKMDRTVALNTFGTTEARERFADAIVEGAVQAGGATEVPSEVVIIVDRAISELEKEAESQPQVAKYPIFLGKLYTIRRNWTGEKGEEALRAYTHTLQIAPNYVQVYLGLAEAYLVMGERAKAAEAAQKAFQLPQSPNTKAALFFPVLSVKVLAGEFPNAERFLNEYYIQYGTWPLLIGYSDDSNIKLLIDRALSSRKDLAGRLAFFQLLETRIEHPALYLGIAETYGAIGDLAGAKRYIVKAITLDPSAKGQVNPEFLRLIGPLP